MISIIVPIYNTEEFLPACIDSLLGQTVSDLQLVLVDDASTDNSAVIAKRYAARDKRITFVSQPHLGQSAARNHGLDHATGEYIAFVDADDALEKDWCARHLAAIEGVDYVQSGYKRIIDNEMKIKHDNYKPQLPKTRWQYTSPCMRLYRREAIAGMRFPEGVIYEDVRFSIGLWLSGAKCRMIHYTGYMYSLNPKSTTSRRHPEDEKRLYADLRQKMQGQTLRGTLIILYTIIRLKFHYRLA